MKRAIFLALGLGFLITGKAHAAYDTEQTLRNDTVVLLATVTIPVFTSTQNIILIDLSDTTNYMHLFTGDIHITGIEAQLDKVAASSGSIKIGVVNFVNTSSGSISYFWENSFQKNVSNTNAISGFNSDNAQARCRVNTASSTVMTLLDGGTPYIVSGDRVSMSTTYKTGTSFPTAIVGLNAAPGAGDIIGTFVNNDVTNAINVILKIFYHSHPR